MLLDAFENDYNNVLVAACDETRYGMNCEEECSCVHGDCDFKTGKCTCHSGYEGNDCNIGESQVGFNAGSLLH